MDSKHISLPPAWQNRLNGLWEDFIQVCPEPDRAQVEKRRDELMRVWALSEFVLGQSRSHPERMLDLIKSGDLDSAYSQKEYEQGVAAYFLHQGHGADLDAGLRKYRQREMLRIAWRDLLGKSDVEQTCMELSCLAEALLRHAVQRLEAEFVQKYGSPQNENGQEQQFVVLAMGKLGAYELNFSSDIDLIFAYPEEGETSGQKLSNQNFFIRLGQRLIQCFHQPSADGFVFRMDLRLRPHGESGPLAMNFVAMEDYYQIHGRDWERYAFIKARPVAGDLHQGEQLLRRLRPFVYRRYLDFAAVHALREMKQMIVEQVKRKGLHNNIKLGRGGIREIEFIGQTFQLIRGGRHARLREPRILYVLKELQAQAYLPDYVVKQLIQAYVFLRKLEHSLQEYADQQTHELPKDEEGKLRLALAMNFENWKALNLELTEHRRHVSEHFDQIMTLPHTEAADEQQTFWRQLWEDPKLPEADKILSEQGFDGQEILRLLQASKASAFYRYLTQTGKKRFDQLIPLLIGANTQAAQPSESLQRCLNIAQSIAQRTAYVALLIENPLALSQLVKLAGASPWIADVLAKHPILLDELLDARQLYSPLSRQDLQQQLADWLQAVEADDLEQWMDVLRQFKQVNVLRVAAADLTGVLPLMRVSDYLTDIAEVILEQALRCATEYVQKKHGKAYFQQDGQTHEAEFIVVAYGKLGGIELGYGSDLDLVFIHNSEGEKQQTGGPSVLDNSVYFARLAQRLLHLLSARTSGGVLYDIDIRLRPDGKSGMLVSSLRQFIQYERDRAWVWEHQALVRARPIAGAVNLMQQFNSMREQILCIQRDPVALGKEVIDMRRRMSEAHQQDPEAGYNLKVGSGGMVDIEFIVQYLILRWAHEYPQLCRWSDNIRCLDLMQELGLLAADDVQCLKEAYKAYRGHVHRLSLQAQPPLSALDAFTDFRRNVETIWQKVLESG